MSDSDSEGFFKQQISICLQQAAFHLFGQNPPPKLIPPPTSSFKQHPQLFSLLNTSKLIDHSLRDEWLNDIYLSNKEKVMFCNIKNTRYFLKRNRVISFSSTFESGNLDMVVEAKPTEYHLYLRPDTNVIRPCQWFNFKCKCSMPDTTITFKICNLKETSLYEQGLRPYVKEENRDWMQVQSNLECGETEYGLSITFQYCFSNPQEIVQFAGSPPYTVADLSNFFQTLQQIKTMKIKTLCLSTFNIPIKYLQIGSCRDMRSCVGLAIARQHPGETSGSYVVEGFIKQLMKVSDPNIMWIVVPMVNVDGVFIGNNRHNVAGYDLNRVFNSEEDDPLNKQIEGSVPEVKGIIKLVKQMKSRFGKRFRMFLDFHGHSTMPCSFSYGPPLTAYDTSTNALQLGRLFPELISTHNQHFKTAYCSYTIKKHKENAARSILFRKFKINYSYTIETSYGLGDKNKRLLVEDFVGIGRGIAQGSNEFMQYLISKQESFTSVAKQNSLVNYCRIMMENIKDSILNNKSGSGVEIDSSDDEQEKPQLDTLPQNNNRQSLKTTTKKFRIEKLVKYRKLVGVQDNKIQPIVAIPKILIQSAKFRNIKLKMRKSIFSKRATVIEQQSISRRYQTVTGRNSCLEKQKQKQKTPSIRIKKLSTGNIHLQKQTKPKSLYQTRQKSKSSVTPVLIFY